MNTLLICTNPIEQAKNLLIYGIKLAKDLNLKIELLHILDTSDMSYLAGGAQVGAGPAAITMKEIHDKEKKKTQEFIDQIIEVGKKVESSIPPLSSRVELGHLRKTLPAETSREDVKLLLLANYDQDNYSILKNNISLIEKMYCPVFIVPPNFKYTGVKRVLYATAFEEQDISALQSTVTFAQDFNAEVIVLHVTEDENYEETLKYKGIEKEIKENIDYQKVIIKQTKNEEIAKGIMHFARNNSADVLSLLKKDKNFLEELFMIDTAKKIIKESSLPIYVFCEKKQIL